MLRCRLYIRFATPTRRRRIFRVHFCNFTAFGLVSKTAQNKKGKKKGDKDKSRRPTDRLFSYSESAKKRIVKLFLLFVSRSHLVLLFGLEKDFFSVVSGSIFHSHERKKKSGQKAIFFFLPLHCFSNGFLGGSIRIIFRDVVSDRISFNSRTFY